VFVWSRRDRGRPLQTVELNAPDRQPARAGIGCIVVEKGTPGFTVAGNNHTMGGENLREIRFQDCVLPPENLVLREEQAALGLQYPALPQPQYFTGPRRRPLEEAVRYVKDRKAFGRPIGEFQGMRWKIAEMYKDIEVGHSMLYRACANADPFPDPLLAAVAKAYCNEMAFRVTSEAIQVHGGYGFTDEFPVSRFYRGARYGTLGGGTTETLRDLIGKRVSAGLDPVDGILGLGMF
jgi:alkylation response protein AidB-like acyl-CoA dehydrogenase